jgi:hypothetical protein
MVRMKRSALAVGLRIELQRTEHIETDHDRLAGFGERVRSRFASKSGSEERFRASWRDR